MRLIIVVAYNCVDSLLAHHLVQGAVIVSGLVLQLMLDTMLVQQRRWRTELAVAAAVIEVVERGILINRGGDIGRAADAPLLPQLQCLHCFGHELVRQGGLLPMSKATVQRVPTTMIISTVPTAVERFAERLKWPGR